MGITEWHRGRSDGSIQLRVEIEVAGPAHAHAVPLEVSVEDQHSSCEHGSVELPLLGGGGAETRMEIETNEGRMRWQFWRRCSLAQFGLSTGIFSVFFFVLALSLVAWYYLLLAGGLLGLVWCCIRSRSAYRPVVANATRQQLRASSGGKVRVLSINMCLLPAGINFSGNYLCDGDDRKAERLRKLEDLLDDFDIVLLNELWGSPWSGHHAHFSANAISKGFNVVTDPIGAVSNTGNMILSRFPLRDASSHIFKSHAGWQSMVPNGVLHATTQLPTGEPLHLFTTHLQCTTAPPDELLPPASPSAQDVFNKGMLDLLEKGEKVTGGKCDCVRKNQLLELKHFMDSVVPTTMDKYLLGGDLNIEGGSPEYADMVRLFGRQSLCAPHFPSTYNTDSFLTPPGWRDVEYSVCLDHMFSNLDVEEFLVLQDDISDHRGLSALINPPQPVDSRVMCTAGGELDDVAKPVSLGGAAPGAAYSINGVGPNFAPMEGVLITALALSPCAQMSQSVEALSQALAEAEKIDAEVELAADPIPVPGAKTEAFSAGQRSQL